MMNRDTIQFIFAVVMALGGLVLVFLGMYIEPSGEIHPSVLTALGEILTFAGAVLGIDYRYKYKMHREKSRKMEENEK